VLCALCSVLCALCSVLCALCSVLCALCSVLCALCSVLCALCSTLLLQDPWFEMHLDLVDARCVEQIQVDAFAASAFSGNPAAVVFEHRDEAWMQNVAMENNLAETAFLSQLKCATYSLRWYVVWCIISPPAKLCAYDVDYSLSKSCISLHITPYCIFPPSTLPIEGSRPPRRWTCAGTPLCQQHTLFTKQRE
jgi:hypothetical protein